MPALLLDDDAVLQRPMVLPAARGPVSTEVLAVLRGGRGHDLPGLVETAAPPVVIVACPVGPLLVRGAVEIRTSDGGALPRRRRTVALCRCGKSATTPCCDGTHELIGFRTEPEPPQS